MVLGVLRRRLCRMQGLMVDQHRHHGLSVDFVYV